MREPARVRLRARQQDAQRMMVRSPAISAHKRRSLSQRARRDAEAEQRDPAPAYLPHGAVVGEVVLRLLGLKIPRRKACRFESGPGHQCKTR